MLRFMDPNKTVMRQRTVLSYFTKQQAMSPTSDHNVVLSFDDNTHKHSRTYFIFTDGSQIRAPNTYKSLSVAWAYVIKLRDGSVIHQNHGALQQCDTNQRAELFAIYRALRWCDDHLPTPRNQSKLDIVVYTDSEYSLKCFTLWIHAWKKNNWKNAKKQDVKHRDIIEPCESLIKKYGVKIHHIKSHTNNTDFFSSGNSDADKLATAVTKKNVFPK